MTAKVFQLDTKPGIQRDGTVFDRISYNDGRWVRFQRGRPRKIGGYAVISDQLTGPSRGVWVNPNNGFNQIFSGYNNGLQSLSVDNNGVGAGTTNYTLSNFTASDLNLWQFDGFYDVGSGGVGSILAHPGQNLAQTDASVNTPVLIGDISGTTLSQIGTFTNANAYLRTGSPTVTFSQADILIGAGQTVTGTGIPANTTVVSKVEAADILSTVAVTGTSGTFSCVATSGLYVGQTVSVTGFLGTETLSSVAITSTAGAFSCGSTTSLYENAPVTVTGTPTGQALAAVAVSGTSGFGTFTCTSTTGLAVGQPIAVSGTYNTTTLASVAITGVAGTFSCTASTLYVGMPLTTTGTAATTALASVAVTGTAGQCSCTAVAGLYIGQPVLVTGTLTGTATGIATNRIYYIIATDGTTTFQLSATFDGSAITTTAGTTTGLTFTVTLLTGVSTNRTYYVIATNGTTTFTLSDTLNGSAINTNVNSISGLTFAGPVGTGLVSGRSYYIIVTNGTSSFTLSSTLSGAQLTDVYGATTGLTFTLSTFSGVTTGTTYFIKGAPTSTSFVLSATVGGTAITTVTGASLAGLTFNLTKSTGLTSPQTYYIIATNFSTTFTLSATSGGSAVTTVVTSTTGLVFTLGSYTKVTLSNNATATGNSTLTFNNNVFVSGGVVTLHPYVFVYGNNGLIRNCAAGNAQDWVSTDANEVNVAAGKIVQALPVRGGSNAPSGLFWSLDSLIRVSYIGGSGTPPQFWRYDIITSQSSILSSQSAIEYDGVYYWCGVDRFLLYNGTVKEIPNSFNQNYFFDNLNYNQRQKVWVTKVPRYGEIWWFYPRGNATECTDAIIYNVRENVWYDAGEALGSRRSAGYFSQVLAHPVMAGWETTDSTTVFTQSMTTESGSVFINLAAFNIQVEVNQVVSGTNIVAGTKVISVTSSAIQTLGSVTGGSGYVNGTYNNVPLTGGSGANATATIVVSGGAVTSVTITLRGAGYVIGNTLSASNTNLGGSGAGFSIPVTAIYAQTIRLSTAASGAGTQDLTFSTPADLILMWQHEVGTDAIAGQNVFAIDSYFETNDLGWVAGGPPEQSMVGENRWLRLERIEPDFIQEGDMTVVVTGRPFAQGQDVDSDPYTFGPDVGKVDMREQRRELRLRFRSNIAGGNYQLGKLLLSATIGDVRPY
jgi:hypothetical protein